MLRLEKLPRDKITIRIRAKGGLFDVRFLRCFFYSVLFHAIIFGTFRVEYLRIHDSCPPLVPVEVHVDNEPEETVLAETKNLSDDDQKGLSTLTAIYPTVPYAKKPVDFDQMNPCSPAGYPISQPMPPHEMDIK